MSFEPQNDLLSKPSNESTDKATQIANQNSANINLKVIGVGGAGNNAIAMLESNKFQNVEFIVANTDAQALFTNKCKNQIALGKESRGLGAGSDPQIGAKRAQESLRDVEEKIKGADVVIIAAGFGGGTGTGASPIIAEAAKNAGALTIAIVTTPFLIEGKKRTKAALEGIERLKTKVDSYIVVSNEKLLDNYGDVPVEDTFLYSNLYLKNIIVAIHDVLYRVGKINIDYADVRKVLDNAGLTLVGLGKASGKDRAVKAVQKAFDNNLYSTEITGAERFLINIQYDKTATLNEVRMAINKVNEILNKDPDVEDEIIIGQETLDTEEDIFQVSIIAGKVIEKKAKKENPVIQELNNELVQEQPMISVPTKEEVKNFDNQEPIIEKSATKELNDILELDMNESITEDDTSNWF
ncbi:cell division protein FtsZ [Mycoplasmopsis ciconiae]|uniref:Cell division protein FtsZ n=1 Tax=Mycoplasmopsis ciconiae TaxID=561067 RepID=A0ABU7MKT6_9BACT|nr:cell division protein FtsZ [Mycoplasmopsis ciconiae]